MEYGILVMENDIDEIRKMGEHLMGGSKPKEKSSNQNFFDAPKLDMAKNEFFSVPEFGSTENPKSSKPLMGGLASEEDTNKLAAMGRKMLGL